MELDGFIIPGTKIQSEIMESTARFQNSVPEAWFPIANFVFDDPIAFDPADGMFDTNPKRSMPLVDVFFQVGKFFASGLLFLLNDSDLIKLEALKTGILG